MSGPSPDASRMQAAALDAELAATRAQCDQWRSAYMQLAEATARANLVALEMWCNGAEDWTNPAQVACRRNVDMAADLVRRVTAISSGVTLPHKGQN